MPTKKKTDEELLPHKPPVAPPAPELPSGAETIVNKAPDAALPPAPDQGSDPKATIELKLEPGQIIFVVTERMANLAHEGRSYPVVDDRIILPATERWYDDLIQAGILKLP